MNKFRFLTAGESHGKCLTAIIEGIPAGFKIDTDFINSELKRRQGGYGRGERMKIESDTVEITSGVRFGKTLGSPVTLVIQNKDFENWQKIMSTNPEDFTDEKSFSKYRPGHADYAGSVKYNQTDLRNILERSSARKTAIEVAVGAVAKLMLKQFEITCSSKIIQIGNGKTEEEFHKEIDKAKEIGDTLGGKFEIVYENLPVGLGSYVHWDRMLDGKIVRKTNNAGGIEGGMTNGEPLVVTAIMKPIPTLRKPLNTVDAKTMEQTEAHFERSDTCAVEACSVVAENRIACVLIDEILMKFGGDNLNEVLRT